MKQGWEIKKLGEVCDKLTDGSHNPPQGVLHSEYEMLSSQNVFNDKINHNAVRFLSYDDFIKEDKRTSVRDGDVLLTIVGTIGRCAVFTGSKNITLQRSVAVVRPKENILSRFLMYCLIGKSALLNEGAHGIAQKGLYLRQLGNILVPVPPREEQERIVEILDREFERIDALKANAEQNLQHAKDLFQAALKQELQPKEGWVTMKLGAFAHMKAGDFIKASDIKDEYFEGAYPCYGGNGLRGYVKEPNRNGEYCLIGRQGALCGNIHITNGVFRATEHAVVVSPYQKMPIKLIYYLLVSLNLNQYSTGAAQPGLSVKNIADNVSISVPPKDIWNSIALRLEVIESNCKALEENYRKTIALCDDMKQALLRQAFNGEL